MNLAERRVVEDFKTNSFPGLKEDVEKAAGFPVEIEVLWETLATPEESHLYADSWRQVYFEPLVAALNDVGRDEMGKSALRDGLKKIVIKHEKECVYGNCWSSFENGVLTLDHNPTTNAQDVDDRKKGLIETLEASL